MSTTIDQRVVEMQFDNRHFERNVSTTMSTLDKFKQKLHLDGATRGLENVNSAAKKVDMTGLGSAVDTVQAKFSAMQVIGVTALANITNSAVNAGKRIVSALTIDPIKTGFQEYETQINAVQTILANTESKGSTIDDVNNALEQLNKYADKTIYNFTEMTRNIGTFTAAGVDLDTSVNAIQGIANLAAVSGSTSQQASTAMYQLSQALSSGTVKLMDWNSVVNAGMGGQVFQDALKETARVHGVAIDSMIEEQGSFRETLSEGWLTADILTETLSKFTMATEDATDAEIEANRAKLKSLGYTDEQIEGIFKLGNTATNAATKVKTFTQLWDVLKESAQSGWAQTWKIIIGDFEEAKSLLTPIADTLVGMINKFSDFRNGILEKVFGGGSKWGSLAKSMKDAGLSGDKLKGITERLTGASDGLNKSLGKTGDYTVKKGDYLYKIAKEYGTTWQEIYKLNKDIIDDPDLIYPNQVLKMPEVFSEMAKGVSELTDEQLKNAGYTKEQIAAYRELEKAAKESGMTVEELIAELSAPMSGRDLLFGAFENFGKAIAGVGTAIKEAWADIFGLPNPDKIADGIYKALEALYKFSDAIKLTDKDGKLNETGLKLQRTFKGIFAAIDIVLTVIGGPLKIALKIVGQLLGAFGVNILDVTAFIGDMIVKLRDWIDGALDFSGVFEKIVDPVKKAYRAFTDWINALKKSKNLPQDIAKGIASGFGKAVTAVKNFFKKIPDLISNGFEGIGDSPITAFVEKFRNGLVIAGKTIAILGDMIRERVMRFLSRAQFGEISSDSIAGLVEGFKNGAAKAWNAAVNMVTTLVQKVKDFLGIHSPSTVFMAIGGFIIAGLVKGIIEGLPDLDGALGDVVDTLKNIVSKIDLGAIFSAVTSAGMVIGFNKIADMFKGIGDMTSGLGDTLSGVGEFLETTASGVNKVLKKSAKGIGKILNNTAKVVKSFSNVLNGIAFETKTEGIKNLAVALAILVGAIVVLTFFKPAELWNAVGVIAVLAAILGALAFAMDKINSSSATIDKNGINIQGLSSGLMGIGMAILLLGLTVKMIGSLDPEEAKQGFLGLAGLVLAMGIVIAAFGLLVKDKQAENMDKLGKTMTKMAIALLLMTIVVKMLGRMDQATLIQGGIAMAAFGGIIVGLMAATRLISGSKNVDTIGSSLLKIALAIGVMAVVVKMLGGMDRYELIQGGIAITAFGGIIVGLMAATKLISGSKNIDKIGSTLLKIALAIGVMGIVAKILGGMDRASLIQGAVAITVFSGIIVGLMAATKLISGSKNIEKIGITLLAISGAIAVMAFTASMLSMVSWEGFAKGTIMITAFAGIMVGLMAATKLLSGSKNVDKIGNTLMSVAGAIAVLALVAVLLGLVPIENLIKGTAIVAVLSAVMAGLIAVTKMAKNCMGNIIAMTVAIAVMATAVWLLSGIDPTGLAAATIAISVLIGMFALLVKASGKAKKAVGTLIVMTAAVGILGAVLYLLASNVNTGDVLGSALALSLLIGVLTGVVIALGKIKIDIANALLGALALLAMAVPLLAFVGVLALMQHVQNATSNAMALIGLTTAMTLLLIPLTIIGAFGTAGLPYLGVLALLAMAVPMIAFVGILALMDGIKNATTNVDLLIGMMTTMTNLLVKLAIVAPFALLGVAAVTALTAVMVAIGALAIGIGALMEKFPVLQDFLNVGLPVLEQLAGGIGRIVGALIAGFMGAIADQLPVIGTRLSEFITNATPFIEGAKNVDSSVLAGVGYLAGAVLALTAADLISGIVSFFQGGSSFTDLGTDLSTFIQNAQPFIEGAKGIDASAMEGVSALVKTLMMITAAELLESITSWITGGTSITTFAEQLVPFGKAIAEFSSTVAGKIDESAVAAAANAGKIMAEMAKELPNSGGVLGWIMGENDMADFAAQLVPFGRAISQFSSIVAGNVDEGAVTAAANAGKIMTEMAKEIPNSGGVLGWIMGENDLSTFATQITAYGRGIRDFSNMVMGLDLSGVEPAVKAGELIAKMATTIPTTGGLWQLLAGEQSLTAFAAGIADFGNGIKSFGTNVKGIDGQQVRYAADAGMTLAQLAASLPTSGGLWQLIAGGQTTSLSAFGAQLGEFGRAMKQYADAVSGLDALAVIYAEDAIRAMVDTPDVGGLVSNFSNLSNVNGFTANLYNFGYALSAFSMEVEDVNYSAITNSVSAIKSLTGVQNIAGFVHSIASTGNNMYWFKTNLVSFGAAIKEYSNEVAGIDKAALSASTTEFNRLANMIRDMSGIKFEGLSSFATSLNKIGKDAVDKFIEAFTNASAKVNKAGGDMIMAFVNGIKSKTPTVTTAINSVTTSAISSLRSKYRTFYSVGSYLVSGFASGISMNSYKAAAKARAMAKAAAEAAEDELDINSPSKVFRKIGTSVPEGFAMGIDKLTNLVTGSSTAMGQAAIDNVKSAISRITDTVNSDIDTQPTIRPILDLTNVRAGANSIGSLLNTNSSVGVLANVGRISGMMDGYRQNGANTEVVSAIDKLRKDLGNMDRASYSINGINVSEGTDAAEAIHTLVRVLKMEGRS